MTGICHSTRPCILSVFIVVANNCVKTFIKSLVVTGLCYITRPCNWSTLNHIIPSTDCVCYFLCDPDRTTPVGREFQPALTSPSSLQLVPMTRIEKRSSGEPGR